MNIIDKKYKVFKNGTVKNSVICIGKIKQEGSTTKYTSSLVNGRVLEQHVI